MKKEAIEEQERKQREREEAARQAAYQKQQEAAKNEQPSTEDTPLSAEETPASAEDDAAKDELNALLGKPIGGDAPQEPAAADGDLVTPPEEPAADHVTATEPAVTGSGSLVTYLKRTVY